MAAPAKEPPACEFCGAPATQFIADTWMCDWHADWFPGSDDEADEAD